MKALQSILQNSCCATSFASFLTFYFFAIFTLFNLSFSSIIVFLVQSFISSNHCLLKIFIQFPIWIFFNFLLYIFLNSTVSFCSTFYLLQPFFFYLNFHINFLLLPFHLSSISSKLSMTKKVILSLSLFDFVSLLVDFFFFLLQPPFFFFY